MPGAGSGSIAWTPETNGYLGGPSGTPTYYLPGTNVEVQTSELTRNLLEILAPGDVETQEFLAQQLEGQLDVSFVLKNDEFHRLVFNDANTGFTSGTADSAIWYLGVDYLSGTTERQIGGWAPATTTIEYTGSDSPVRVTLSGAYGDETENTSITPGTLVDTGDEVAGHGASLTVNGSTYDDFLQSATINFENISRLIRGAKQKPVEAVAGNVTESIDIEHIYSGADFYKLALGGTSATSVQDTMDSVPGSLSFDAAGETQADYTFTSLKPDTYDWTDLINNDADLTESVTLNATGVTASAPDV